MTVLYRLDATADAIATLAGAMRGGDPWAGGTVAPGGFAPVITAGREFVAGPRPAGGTLAPRMVPRVWGVPPPPSASTTGAGRGVLTVRNRESPFWIGNLRNSEFRCLIPATTIMEWGKGADRDGKRRQHWLSLADQPLFLIAGVWKDSEVPSFAMLTCPANAAWRALGHEAMPAILPNDNRARQDWLYAAWARAETVLQPYSSSLVVER